MDIKAQKDMLKDEDKCPDIVVGTPGRIKQVRRVVGYTALQPASSSWC
jgi:superfamily II DNA/RNA helicase